MPDTRIHPTAGIRRVITVSTVLLLAVLLCGTRSDAAPHRRTAAVEGPASVLPPASTADYGAGFTGVGTAARVGRAGINITLPRFPVVAYPFPYHRAQEQHRVGGFNYGTFREATGALLPRHTDPKCAYYYAGVYADLYAADVDQTIDRADPSQSRPGVFRNVGRLPDTPVSLLAFGSVPVTATLHLRQITRRDGTIEPLFADPASFKVSISKKSVPWEVGTQVPLGCDPAWDDLTAPKSASITGRLLVSISDVRVGGHPVAVGAACQTQRPLDINLTGQRPEYGGSLVSFDQGGTVYQRLDRSTANPNNPIALYPNSSNLTIPPFTGCRGPSGDDISRLVSALVSGPDNTLALTFTIPYLTGDIDREHPNLCDPSNVQRPICAVAPTIPLPPAPGR